MMPLPIVLTGGPGGGKTSFLQTMRHSDPHAERYLLVPESATLLIETGLKPGSEAFQEAVFRTQIALEQSCCAMQRDSQRIICDRGTLDSLAYWKLLGSSEQAFYIQTGMSLKEHLSRYQAVIHLQSTAIGAAGHYVQSETGRKESVEEAARIDRVCGEVWSQHPRYFLVPNGPGGWREKLLAARDIIGALLQVA